MSEREAEKKKMPGWRLGAYASGNFSKNILWGMGETTLLYTMTEMLGISAALAGGILLLSLVFDGVLDPVIGYVSDRLSTPFGQFGPLILLGAPVAAISFAGFYALPLFEVRNIWLPICLLLMFRFGYSLIDLPHNALLSKVRSDSRGRVRLSGYRFAFSSLASLIIAFAVSPIFSSATHGDGIAPLHMAVFTAVIGGVSAVVMVFAWFSVREFDRKVVGAHRAQLAPGAAMRAIFKSRNAVIAVAVGALATFTLPLFNKAVLYISRDVVSEPDLATPILIAMVVGQFVGISVWIWLSNVREKSEAMQLAHLTAAIGAGLMLVFLNFSSFWVLCASFVFGLGASGVYTIVWGMLADCVDDVREKTGADVEGRLFAFSILLQKSAIGLGVGVFGFSLSAAGYDAGSGPGFASNTVILAFGLAIPAIGAVLCALLLFLYKLDHANIDG